MRKGKIVLILIIIVLLFFGSVNLNSEDNCKPIPPNGAGHPGGDNPDDNYSYNNNLNTKIYFITPNVIVYKKGYYETWIKSKNNMVSSNNAITDLKEGWEEVLKSGNTLIFPTGSLFSNQNDKALKETLKQYVSNGGTIVVFAQQYGRHVENIVPIPDGEKLKVYGWREDQSCYWSSVYGSIKHPVISSLKSDRASVAVDGYIDEYPQNSVILSKSLEAKSPQPKAFVNQRS